MRALLTVLSFAVALAGCATTAAPRVDLAGRWAFQVNTGAGVTHGAMNISSGAEGYRGTLTTDQGQNTLVVRSLTLEGANMHMLVESPNGPVTFDGVLDGGGTAFEGAVTYHNGQRFPMSGARE